MTTIAMRLSTVKDDLIIRGFGLIALIAGLSKFVAMEAWAKFLPPWFFPALPIPGPVFGMFVTILESLGGLCLLLRVWVKLWSILAAIWLLKLMVLLLLAGHWAIALRDLGLFLMAVYSFAIAWQPKTR
ncbi:MAG: hypothetical protein HY915_13650 [Desulfovibrio sp.]|nr:hypothetical protein [Desulfovibrio sp.]